MSNKEKNHHITTVYQTIEHFSRIFTTLPCSCLLQRLNISEDIMTSSCQTWIKCRQQVVVDLCRTFQRCHIAHTHTLACAIPILYCSCLYLQAVVHPKLFIPWQNVWTEPPPAIVLNALVENVSAAQRCSWLHDWNGRGVLFCRSHWQPKSKQKFVWSCSAAPSLVRSGKPSGCLEGHRQVKVFGRGEPPREAGVWKFTNQRQTLAHQSLKSTLNM